MGMSYKFLNEDMEALAEFEKAEKLNPNNMHNTFHRANLLLKLEQNGAAEVLLNELVKKCPKEP